MSMRATCGAWTAAFSMASEALAATAQTWWPKPTTNASRYIAMRTSSSTISTFMLRRRLQGNHQLHKITLWATGCFDGCRELLGHSPDDFRTKSGALFLRHRALPRVADRQNQAFSLGLQCDTVRRSPIFQGVGKKLVHDQGQRNRHVGRHLDGNQIGLDGTRMAQCISDVAAKAGEEHIKRHNADVFAGVKP